MHCLDWTLEIPSTQFVVKAPDIYPLVHSPYTNLSSLMWGARQLLHRKVFNREILLAHYEGEELGFHQVQQYFQDSTRGGWERDGTCTSLGSDEQALRCIAASSTYLISWPYNRWLHSPNSSRPLSWYPPSVHHITLNSAIQMSLLLGLMGRATSLCRQASGHMQLWMRSSTTPCQQLKSRLEPPGLSRSDGKRPDGTMLVPRSARRPSVWDDATCTDTFTSSLQESCHQTSMLCGCFCRRQEVREYLHLTPNYHFQLEAVESSGDIGPSTVAFP